MGFAPTWLRQVPPLLHKTTLTTVSTSWCVSLRDGKTPALLGSILLELSCTYFSIIVLVLFGFQSVVSFGSSWVLFPSLLIHQFLLQFPYKHRYLSVSKTKFSDSCFDCRHSSWTLLQTSPFAGN